MASVYSGVLMRNKRTRASGHAHSRIVDAKRALSFWSLHVVNQFFKPFFQCPINSLKFRGANRVYTV